MMDLPNFDGPIGELKLRPDFADEAEKLRQNELAEARERARNALPKAYQWVAGPERKRLLFARVKLSEAKIREALETTQNVVILGPPGSGKTSLACAILLTRIARGDGRERFLPAFDLAEQAHKAERSRGPETEDMKFAELAEDVVIDDLGIEAKAWDTSPLARILYRRHLNGKRTIVTTGLEEKELREIYGGGIVRRIFEGAVEVRCAEEASKRRDHNA